MSTKDIWLDFVIDGRHREYSVVENPTTKERRLVLHHDAQTGVDEVGHLLAALNHDEKVTLIALASEWHGTFLELIDAAKELSK